MYSQQYSATDMLFPIAIRFVDTNKIKQVFSYDELRKHIGQPIEIVTQIRL